MATAMRDLTEPPVQSGADGCSPSLRLPSYWAWAIGLLAKVRLSLDPLREDSAASTSGAPFGLPKPMWPSS
jgi:hypothetical protein